MGERMHKRWIVLGVLFAAVVVGWASGFFHGFTTSFVESRRMVLEGHRSLPSCDSETGLFNAKAAINSSPLLKQYGVIALGISDAKASSVSDKGVECEGMVTLSSAARGPIHYSFTKDPSVDAPFLVKAKIDLDKLEKF
jgi:hypothetical protein